MRVSQLRQTIKEEIQKEIQQATLSPGEDNMAQSVRTQLEDGNFEVITPTNLRVGDKLVLKRNMVFAEITNIEGDRITVEYVKDSTKSTLKRDKVESSFLRVVPEEQSQEPLNEQFRRMQKLAGIITEGMSSTATNESSLNESSFTFTYNTDPDDLDYFKKVLSRAGVTATVKKGTFEDEVEVVVDKKDLNKAKRAIEGDGISLN